jgi:hypothetical protein
MVVVVVVDGNVVVAGVVVAGEVELEAAVLVVVAGCWVENRGPHAVRSSSAPAAAGHRCSAARRTRIDDLLRSQLHRASPRVAALGADGLAK